MTQTQGTVVRALRKTTYVPGCFYAWNPEAGEFYSNKSAVNGVDISKCSQERALIEGGTLYRYENMVQVWWDHFPLAETWIVPTAADAQEGFQRLSQALARKTAQRVAVRNAVRAASQRKQRKAA